MEKRSEKIYISQLDTERFGVKIARAVIDQPEDVETANQYCRENSIAMLVARCNTSCIKAVQKMEEDGYRLMDTLLYYNRHLTRKPIPGVNANIIVRPLKPGEEETVREIAAEAFRGYMGHYHADPRLSPDLCDEGYVSWAYNSCISKELADIVMVAVSDNMLTGFHTLRMNSAMEGEAVLTCIRPKFQGGGIYREFEIRGMEWCLEQGAQTICLSTQVTNTAVQRVWVRLGFEPSHSYYTLHRWYD